MAESFGNEFTVVEVTSDSGSTEIWLTLAKPSQAVTLVLAAIPEGWTAQILTTVLTDKQVKTFRDLKLRPGEIYRLSSQ